MTPLLRVLACGEPHLPPLPASIVVDRCAALADAPERSAAAAPHAIVIAAATSDEAGRLLAAEPWQPLLRDVAVLLVLPALDEALALRLVDAGVQDVLQADELGPIERRIRFAVARKQIEREARKSWSTDLDTGLPNREQLLEHLSQLLALRERQPAPTALLVLRVAGLDAIAAAHGTASAQVVRRKVAVRLRAAVRASNVVASLGGQAFALLLSKLEAPADAQRVALKLARALREPFNVLGAAVGVTAHVGVALHPQHGSAAEPLLRHAAAAALETQRRLTGAAND